VRRTSARQREIDLLRRERSAAVEQLAGVLLDLDRRGELTQGPLQAIAARLKALTDDINRGESEITAIRNETFVPGTISINVQRKDDSNAPTPSSSAYTTCPSCGRSVRRSAAFCSACGAKLK
jgi:hypothetical protein